MDWRLRVVELVSRFLRLEPVYVSGIKTQLVVVKELHPLP